MLFIEASRCNVAIVLADIGCDDHEERQEREENTHNSNHLSMNATPTQEHRSRERRD